MYYALTIKDNIITGVHESGTPITDTTFSANPELAGHMVVPIEDMGDYRTGQVARHKLVDGVITERTAAEIAADIALIPPPSPTDAEVMRELVELLLAQGVIVNV